MCLKKTLMAGMAGLMLSALLVVPVSAHGHHRQSQTTTDTRYPVCTVEDCTEKGHHLHDDEYYCGYDHEDGYCDGSCQTAVRSARKHHGRRHSCHMS